MDNSRQHYQQHHYPNQCRPSHVQQHRVTVHHSDLDPPDSGGGGHRGMVAGPNYGEPVTNPSSHGLFDEVLRHHSGRHCTSRSHAKPPSYRVTGQVQSFDDSQLRYQHHKQHQQEHSHYYPRSEPQTSNTLSYQQQNSLPRHHSHHHHHRRRHSSTSRLKHFQHTNSAQSAPAKNNSMANGNNFITNITSNFMSFGAPFLFDWRLFCERGQPRYVHKHEGDGLRVDECEARFLSKIVNEEKSLSNVNSDDDDHSASVKQQQRKCKSGTAAANVECLGSVRKSGFLSVKKWLIRKKTWLELARKQVWKGYWVCLKGTTLLLYRCDCGESNSGGHVIEARPRHLIFVDACLVQAIPEHPKRDFVFCLSTAFGDAYLLDAPCLVERDHWIAAIHCACAAQLARSSGRVTVSHVLHKEIKRLEDSVQTDTKSRAEAEQIVSTALVAGSLTPTEAKSKQTQLFSQIHRLEEKIEKNRTEIFRFRAYLAALISEEDPNPKTLLSQTTKRSKVQLNRLGVFSVSSLHAFNCAKNPTIIGNITRSRSTEDNLGIDFTPSTSAFDPYKSTTTLASREMRAPIIVKQLNGDHHKLDFNATLTADQVLGKILPAPIAHDYYLRRSDNPSVVFKRFETVLDHANQTLEVVPKIMFTCEMTRDSTDVLFGFSVESDLCQDDLRVYVSRVEIGSLAATYNIRRSDEIVVINGALVQDLDMMYVESVLQEELALCLTIRAAREENTALSRPNSRDAQINSTWNHNNEGGHCESVGHFSVKSDMHDVPSTDELIESLVCPPPPPIDVSQMILSEKQLSKYIVPKVDSYLLSPSTETTKERKQRSQDHNVGSSKNVTSTASQARSLPSRTSKSGQSSSRNIADTVARPHSAAAVPICNHHGHHGHHHGHHSVRSGGSSSLGSTHHHHHHHHHHSSTKHVYHITDPQPGLYGLLEQHLLANQGAIVPIVSAPAVVNNLSMNSTAPPTTNDQSTVSAVALQQALDQAQVNATTVASDPNMIAGEQTQLSVTETNHIGEQIASAQIAVDSGIDIIEGGKSVTIQPTQQCEMPSNITTTQSQIQEEQSTTAAVTTTNQSFTSELMTEKLRKIVHELLDTEITYCQTLDQLMTLYLDPVLKSCTLTNMDARRLIGSIPEVIITQNQFREDLTTIINNDDLNIEGIAKCFLNYCNDFKNYSTFCASHAKASKLMNDEKTILHEWLSKHSIQSKHPTNYTLESYLIRPIQRLLKYPLLLAQIKTLCPRDSQPYYKINEALRSIESVAEHINEMQRINEEYGAIFENLILTTKVASKKNPLYLFDLSPTSLIHYGGVEWINSMEFLGKSFRKSTSNSSGLNLHSMCFVFKQCVVFLCKETIRHKTSKKQVSAADMEIIRHQVLIPVSDVQVRASSASGEHELDYKWELIQLIHNNGKRSEKIFKLSNSTNEYRNAFLRTIRQIIREDVRRMDCISGTRPAMSGRSETSPTSSKKSTDTKARMVSFASTQNLASGKCDFCGEDFKKLCKKSGG